MAAASGDKAAKENGLDHVKMLLKRIARGFYETKHSILLDIVLAHSAIRDDHVAQIMGLQNVEVRKLCGRLREDRLITLYTRLETKEGQTRPLHRTYYFVDYRDAVDSVKYRIHRLVRIIEEKSKNDFDSKGYVCPYCQRRYGPLDVLPYVSMDGQSFDCATCGNKLADDEESLESKASQERLGRLQQQTNQIITTLKAIDNSYVPNNDFVAALANAIPPSLDLVYSAAYPHGIPTTSTNSNSNVDTTTTSALGVSIDYNATQEDTAEEKAKKAAQARMNQLPEWHKNSTVPGSASQVNLDVMKSEADEDDVMKDVKLDANAADEVAEYYRALKEQKKMSESGSDSEEEGPGGSASMAPSTIDSNVATPIEQTNVPAVKVEDETDDSDDDVEFEDIK